jgi:SAM-dependent methyltransferase
VGGAGLGGVGVTSYDSFAPFYDAVMGDRAEHASYIRSLIRRHAPRATRVLELACGTGSILAQLAPDYDVAGVDRSRAMLEVARKKVPSARLVHADMTDVQLEEEFDVVLCVFDSINHLLRFREWEAVFRRAREHIGDRGIFVFDINTQHRLEEFPSGPPTVEWFGDGNLITIVISARPRGGVVWHLNVFEPVGDSTYRLHRAEIPEVSFPAERIRTALRKRFTRVWTYDAQRSRPSPRSGRLHFVCRV